ncbi:brachyurin-like isoform X1 [Chironomus tepperi]|uniref:brachyurin-like isoform X1 n=1 Tax=Chironomus tepperi TaxID=113505 RepID=UPI00391F14FD
MCINWGAFERRQLIILCEILGFISLIITIVFAIRYFMNESFEDCAGPFGDTFTFDPKKHKNYEYFTQGMCSGKFIERYENDDHKFPFIARLVKKRTTQVICGGSLISNRDILTAGHCFFLDEAYDIHLGGTPAKNYSDAIRVKNNQYELFVHPEYNHSLVKNDIALIKLNKPVTFSETIHPIRLSFNNFDVPQNLTLTGWNSSNPHIFPKLRERLIPTIPVRQCEYRINKTIEDKVLIEVFTGTKMSLKFCGGDIDTRIKQGDSGMPIQSMDDNGPIAYGIISVGTKSNKDGSSPQIFTNIYPYLHWILCNAGEKFYKVPNKG